MDQQQLRPCLDHELSCSHLFSITTLTVELVSKVQKFLGAEFFEAVTETDISVDINRQVHESFFPRAGSLACLALSN